MHPSFFEAVFSLISKAHFGGFIFSRAFLRPPPHTGPGIAPPSSKHLGCFLGPHCVRVLRVSEELVWLGAQSLSDLWNGARVCLPPARPRALSTVGIQAPWPAWHGPCPDPCWTQELLRVASRALTRVLAQPLMNSVTTGRPLKLWDAGSSPVHQDNTRWVARRF